MDRTALTGTWVIALLALSAVGLRAEPLSLSVYSYDAKSQDTVYKTPEDVIPRIPLLNLIPRRFLLDRYTLDLSWNDIRLDHHGVVRRAIRPQSLWISMSYAQAFSADSLSSRLDVPLLSSERFGASWQRASLNDYAVHFLHNSLDSSGLRLLANAKFN